MTSREVCAALHWSAPDEVRKGEAMKALTIGVWAFAFAVASCALAVLWFVRHNRRML
jgi:hypothetical protein